jgi:hypothetical protein
MKLCQLSTDKLYEKQIRDELWANRETYTDRLDERIGQLAAKLKGINYEAKDVVAHAEEYRKDPAALIYINPPGFSKGYAKIFDTKGLITWSDPHIPEFDAKTGRLKHYKVMMPAPAMVSFFRSKQAEEGFEDKSVLATERGLQFDYMLYNRPDEAGRAQDGYQTHPAENARGAFRTAPK